MLRPAMSHARLMRESTDRVEAALESEDRNEGDPNDWPVRHTNM